MNSLMKSIGYCYCPQMAQKTWCPQSIYKSRQKSSKVFLPTSVTDLLVSNGNPFDSRVPD